MKPIQDRLVDKSIEAFIMGLELYNKPTIQYRIEGFSFFICNAWELMLKAKMINDGKSIYHKNHSDRTLSLSDVVKKVYTDKRQPLRVNLEKIITLRNTSTHYVTEDHEPVYAPLFQFNVIKFSEEILRHHDIDVTEHIAQNFLVLSTSMNALTNNDIKVKYDSETAEKLILAKNDIDVISSESKITIPIEHRLFISRKGKDADFTLRLSSDGKDAAAIITKLKDPADTHKINFENMVKLVSAQLKKKKIPFEYENAQGTKKTAFTRHILSLFIGFYDMKTNEKWAYAHIIGKTTTYTYSQVALDFIVEEIRKNPSGIIDGLRSATKDNEAKEKR